MDYTSFQAALSTETVIPSTDPNFVAILPNVIDYAELRIYRDFNLLNSTVRDGTVQLASNNRNLTAPTLAAGTWLIVDGINVITPAATAPDSGTRIPLLKVTQTFIDNLATAGTAAVPQAFAMITDTTAVVGPIPNAAYFVEIYGKIRPNSLSATNTTTMLTTNFPDLFLAAAMVFMSGYMRDFGQQSGDPALSQSWETQYKTLAGGVAQEEMRKRLTAFNGRALGGVPRAA